MSRVTLSFRLTTGLGSPAVAKASPFMPERSVPMNNRKPLMPKATAVWLVENTALSFQQVADFCGLHPLEVKGIADGDVAAGIKGLDPIATGQLTREEIDRAVKDPDHGLEIATLKVPVTPSSSRKGPRYTPVSRRQDRPNAVLWLIRNHSELKDSQIMRLVGTTKPTIQQIRERSHWNSANLSPQDPVALALCSQIDLDAEVMKAAKRSGKTAQPAAEAGGTLLPASVTAGALGSPKSLTGVALPGANQPDVEDAPLSERDEEKAMMARLKGLVAVVETDDSVEPDEGTADDPLTDGEDEADENGDADEAFGHDDGKPQP